MGSYKRKKGKVTLGPGEGIRYGSLERDLGPEGVHWVPVEKDSDRREMVSERKWVRVKADLFYTQFWNCIC